MKKTIKVALNLTKLNIEKDLIYSLNTWFLLFTTLAYSLAYILSYKFVFDETGTVLGVTFEEMFMLLLGGQLFWYMQQVLFRKSMQYLADLINTGGLDMFLLKPINLKGILTFLDFDQRHLIPSIVTIGVIGYKLADYNLGLVDVALIVFFFVNGLLISFFLSFLAASMTFWVGKNDPIFHIFLALVDLVRLPVGFFPPILNTFFLFVIPVIPVLNPSYGILYSKESTELLLISVGMTVVMFLIAEIVWRQGLKNYTSAN
ncbi:hypothetical protein GF389_05410 [Candidatus Dojkabacteria bacterium]|nr:hypothetical protein [Candidatus Dojkabacteria bacterium]